MARLVNKQFNSPIGLYSQQNIQDVIHRESQMLSNGAVGIDFNNPDAGKPTNLKNSAVLRMLEEEERHGSRTGVKRVAWPPPHETDLSGPQIEQTAPTEGGPRYPQQVSNYQNINQQPKSHGPLKLDVSVSQSGVPSLVSPSSNQSPSGYNAPNANKVWAPVQSPVITPKQSPWTQNNPNMWQPQYQPTGQQYTNNVQELNSSYSQQFRAPGQAQYQNLSNQYQTTEINSTQQQQRQYSANSAQYSSPQRESVLQYSQGQGAPAQGNQQASRFVEPPPTSITLRSQVPVNQVPPPVYTSQPATTTLKGGKHLRGDLKWPPENVKVQAEEENRLRLELARGPVCRPRKVQKDYSSFFEQHALNFTYPGYKIPPGTQFYRTA